MKKKEISLCVVIYDKRLKDSVTLTSLLSELSHDSDHVLHVRIFNNGPEVISDVELNEFFQGNSYDVKIKNLIHNESLSVIYNSFIQEETSSDVYVFLDDDSLLSYDYISNMLNFDVGSFSLQLPYIIDESGKCHYPILNDSVVESGFGEIITNDNVLSIGSGIIMSSSLALRIIERFGSVFDERFFFYGVDISFFMRLRCIKTSTSPVKVMIKGGMIHSLSRNEVVPSSWRLRERFIDDVLFRVIYSKSNMKKYLSLFKILLKTMPSHGLKFFPVFFGVIKNKKHPRSNY